MKWALVKTYTNIWWQTFIKTAYYCVIEWIHRYFFYSFFALAEKKTLEKFISFCSLFAFSIFFSIVLIYGKLAEKVAKSKKKGNLFICILKRFEKFTVCFFVFNSESRTTVVPTSTTTSYRFGLHEISFMLDCQAKGGGAKWMDIPHRVGWLDSARAEGLLASLKKNPAQKIIYSPTKIAQVL